MIGFKTLIKGLDVLGVTFRLLVLRKAKRSFRILHPNPIVSVNMPPTAATTMNTVSGIGHSVVKLKCFMIISPGEDAEIGTIAFPNTRKIPDNKQMDELTVVGLSPMLSLLRHLVSTCGISQPRGLPVPPVGCNRLMEKEPCR